MNAMASQITGVSIVYSSVCSDADQRKHQSSASQAFVRGYHRSPVDSPHKGPVTWKMFPFDDVIMNRFSSFQTNSVHHDHITNITSIGSSNGLTPITRHVPELMSTQIPKISTSNCQFIKFNPSWLKHVRLLNVPSGNARVAVPTTELFRTRKQSTNMWQVCRHKMNVNINMNGYQTKILITSLTWFAPNLNLYFPKLASYMTQCSR